MRTEKNSVRLREILVNTRHQIVALKDIQIDLLTNDAKIANQVAIQISALEEVYKHQLSLVTLTENAEPKRNGWLSNHIKPKQDRLANVMD